LFGTVAEPLNHGVMWSLSVNALFFFFGSLSRASLPLERIQAAIFVPRRGRAHAQPAPLPHLHHGQRHEGHHLALSRVERTERSFQSFEATNGTALHGYEQASMEVIRFSEQLWPAPSAPPRRG